MKASFLPVRRIWQVLTVVVVLLATTAQSASACAWTCLWEFGLIEVRDGEVYYYAGCVEIQHEDYTEIICYYDQFFN